MNIEELKAQVSALQMQPGTVVVLSLNLDTSDNWLTAKAMAEQLRHAVPQENPLLVLQRPAEIQALDEAQMRELGWVKPAQFRLSDNLLKAMIQAYYQMEGNSTGGSLHIVLDDGNYERHHVEFCLQWAKDRDDPDGVMLAGHLLLLTDEERRVLLGVDSSTCVDDEGGAA